METVPKTCIHPLPRHIVASHHSTCTCSCTHTTHTAHACAQTYTPTHRSRTSKWAPLLLLSPLPVAVYSIIVFLGGNVTLLFGKTDCVDTGGNQVPQLSLLVNVLRIAGSWSRVRVFACSRARVLVLGFLG